MTRDLSHLMTATEVAKALGVPRETLYQHRDVLDRLRAEQPIGYRRYARVLVERLKQDRGAGSRPETSTL